MTPDHRTARFNRLRALFMRWRAQPRQAPKPQPPAPKPPPQRRGIASPERLARIHELHQEGTTRAQLMKNHGYQLWVIEEAEDRYGFKALVGRKGRQKGSSSYDVQAIRAAVAQVGNCAEVARRMGINRRTVWSIVKKGAQ